jgi:hypothetical protein
MRAGIIPAALMSDRSDRAGPLAWVLVHRAAAPPTPRAIPTGEIVRRDNNFTGWYYL